MTLAPTSRVAMLGFGMRARTFAKLLAPRGCALRAWDPRLAGPEASRMRTRIEAAGVDALASQPEALRGARLVVLDGTLPAGEAAALLQTGQRLLDLADSPASEIDAVLVALGLPPGAHWQRACAAARAAMANSPDTEPVVPRGELP